MLQNPDSGKINKFWYFCRVSLASSSGVILLCALLAFVWSVFIPLDVLVRGNGLIRVEGHNIDLQHAEGGTISELYGAVGQTVKTGDILAKVISPALIEDFERSRIAVEALELREDRLKAEIDGQPFEPVMVKDPELAEIIESELAFYNARARALNEAIDIAKSQLSQKESQIKELQGRIEDLGQEMQLAGQHVRLLEPLVAKGAAAEVLLVQRKLEYQKVFSALRDAKARLPRITAEKEETQLKMQRFRTEFISEANKMLSQVQVELPQAHAKLVSSRTRMDSSKIVSPVDGVIQRVLTTHTGAVIKPGEIVFEIAPSSVPLVADVKVSPQDRDRLWVGMQTRVRVAAFGGYFSNTLDGTVSLISADALGDDEKGRYYQVTIDITSSTTKSKIFPGMSVEAFMLAGSRTFAQYLFKPFFDGVSVVFSE